MESSSNTRRIKYDVFISFRGEDIRTAFLSHLTKEFRRNQIDFFIDDEKLHPGDEISSTLLQAIEESSISLVIFSKRYAASRWCMEELVKIIQCMKQYERIVIPVFYNIDPSDVRHQKRTFAEAFDVHKERYEVEHMQNWRSVLKEAANLSGIHYPSKYRNESELVEEIVKHVSEKLSHPLSNASESLIGMDENFKRIQPLLAIESDEVQFLGIWGMGGIGKTTIAKAIFDRYSSRYEGCCFLQNVREESEKFSPHYLHEKLVSELLEGENLLVKGSAQARSMYVKRRLSRKKVLIVLDDVDTLDKLEHLAGEQICLGAGSRIIVTTRDEQILIAARVQHIYNVQELSFESSLKLFCLKAFHQSYPENGYEKLSDMAVHYAKGIPLALKVLGSFLCSRSAVAWESALRKLKTHPDSSIFNVLKLSYDGLDDSEKNIFLDIAFFFKGEYKDNVIRFLDSCDFFADIGIDTLERKALITISNNRIEMHDLIQQMGWEVVSKESNKDPGKLTRINRTEDFYNLLKNSESNVCVPTTLEPFSAKLRYLEWNSYPLNSLPSRFCAEKLVEIRMPYSEISKLWDGKQDLENLTVLDLRGCIKLVELPDFSKATKLKTIDLCYCEKLYQLHPSILYIQTLEQLHLNGCTELKSVKGNVTSLKELHANKCSSLEEFSVSSETVTNLCFCFSRIKNLADEFSCFISLEDLCLCDCRELIELPHNIKTLSSLRTLEVRGCCGLRSIPELPPSIQVFRADGCTSLERIFSLKAVFSLNRRKISFVNCVTLEEESVNEIMEDAHLTIFRNVLLWSEDRNLMNYNHYLDMDGTLCYPNYLDVKGSVCYPGYKVPELFRCQTEEASSITVELDQPYYRLLGFFFCCVVSHKLPPHYLDMDGGVNIKCEYLHLGHDIKHTFVCERLYFIGERRCNSDHVLIWNDPICNADILSKTGFIRGSYGSDDDESTCNEKMSFRFSVDRPGKGKRVEEREEDDEDCFIKGCGVYPVYASTVLDVIHELELEFKLNPHHDSTTGMDLEALKSAMIRMIRAKSIILCGYDSSSDSEEESCSDTEKGSSSD
ncbi:hypothetical protein PIB30_033370 [Stylosanthes scabra]|uniref:TIR domain-containing protein n=1 Tax=Stylosanthes scabra TaxID=79078 RepID=A0ABU6YCQ8_9FABA|nr:hypothetical protein [Stylosanthes scabra]